MQTTLPQENEITKIFNSFGWYFLNEKLKMFEAGTSGTSGSKIWSPYISTFSDDSLQHWDCSSLVFASSRQASIATPVISLIRKKMSKCLAREDFHESNLKSPIQHWLNWTDIFLPWWELVWHVRSVTFHILKQKKQGEMLSQELGFFA